MSNQNSSKHKLRTKLILIYLIIFGLKTVKGNRDDNTDDKSATYQYSEFDYKDSNKNELAYRDMEIVCEKMEPCRVESNRIQKVLCIRICISTPCFKEIYGTDRLEEGEIDVRFNSFKGCVIKGLTKPTII